MKETFAVLAIVLTFVGYVPYIRNTIKGKTTPHVYSWLIWGLVTAIAFALQVSDSAGPGAYTTLAAAVACFGIFGMSIKHGKKNITTSDTVFFIISLLAIVFWVFARQPVLTVLLVTLVGMLGFIPTFRKSWHKPNEETLFSYLVSTLRFCFALVAIDNYTLITVLYPAMWVVANGSFSAYLLVRRMHLDRKINKPILEPGSPFIG